METSTVTVIDKSREAVLEMTNLSITATHRRLEPATSYDGALFTI